MVNDSRPLVPMVLTVRVLWTCCSIVIPATREQGPITAKNSLKSITACCAGAGMADLCPSDDDGAETDPKFIKRGFQRSSVVNIS